MSISEERSPTSQRLKAPPPPIRSGPLKPGDILAGRFELRRPLGSGGLAEVWVARDLKAGTDVALKLLHEHLCADDALTDRFRRELAVTRDLSHPNIVRVFDLHEHPGKNGARPFFAMELLEGRTLADQLKLGPMPADEARRIAKAIALALDAAHRRGVVHRDLKPQNIILTKQGGVKLLDFGLARAAGWSRLTAQSTVMGTPGYIAPEILQGKQADARADLYSLGAVMFEMLTGKRAIASADVFAALRKKAEPPPSPRALVPEVSEADDAVVRRALEPDPEQRFLDSAQMLRALEGIAVAPPQPLAIELTAGDRDVVLQNSHRSPGKALKAICARLGLRKPGIGFRIRLTATGRNVLAAGVSRASAELIANLCRAEGLAATVEPAKPIGKLRRWIAPRVEKLAALLGVAMSTWLFHPHHGFLKGIGQAWHLDGAREAVLFLLVGLIPWLVFSPLFSLLLASLALPLELPAALAGPRPPKRNRLLRWLEKKSSPIAAVGAGSFAGLFIFLLVPDPTMRSSLVSWGLFVGSAALSSAGALAFLALWRRAPVVSLQPGDTELRRLQRGIEERFERLRRLMAGAQPASQMVLEGAFEMAELAKQRADQLAAITSRAGEEAALDATAEPNGVAKLPAGSEGSDAATRMRDANVDRLLRVASTLDDLLAAKEGPAQSELLAALRMELGAPPSPARGQRATAIPAQRDAEELLTLPPHKFLKD